MSDRHNEHRDIAIVSGCDKLRYASYVGHQLYARKHDLAYHLELAPFAGAAGYWHKAAALGQHLEKHDWLVWLDDDAFITDIESDWLRREIAAAERTGAWLVIAPSAEDELNGAWAAYNTGVFAVRNCAQGRELVGPLNAPNLDEVERWWDATRLGMFTRGDQDVLVWFVESQGHRDSIRWVEPRGWNARPWHYTRSLKDAPVCHFPGHPDTSLAIHDFARRLGTDMTLTRVTSVVQDTGLHAQVPRLSTHDAAARRLSLRGRAAAKRVRLKYAWLREHRTWR